MATMAAVVNPSWLARLWRRAGGEVPGLGPPQVDGQDPLVSAGNLLRQAREARGLNLRQLALETRISTPVLEALERGWRDRLPEMAYLRTMLPLLERHLGLERGSLRQALAATEPLQARRDRGQARQPLLSVQLFSTWQGTAVYGVLLLLVLYALNLEQRRLAAQGLLALNPLPPLAERAQRGVPPAGSALLLDLYPELRPLALARQGQALAVLRRPEPAQAAGSAPPQPPQQAAASGVLSLQLSRPSRVQLRTADGQSQTLQLGAGELLLPLVGPAELSVVPPPEPGQDVLWNGAPLSPVGPGRYRWPRAAISP
jgi:transcriptional regulator with XRE-family HTH domain